jgi:hypothetical protein
MRMLVKINVPNQGGNEAVKNGSIGRIVQGFLEEHRPEAAYFIEEGGERTALFVMDVKDSSEIPRIAEPYFIGLNARVTFAPAMNAQDLAAGLARVKI